MYEGFSILQFDETLGNLVREGIIEEDHRGVVRFYRIRDQGRHWFTREQILRSVIQPASQQLFDVSADHSQLKQSISCTSI